MKIDLATYEAFALKILETDERQHHVQGGVDFCGVGALLGLSQDEITDYVVSMQEDGYVKLDYRLNPPVLSLTKHGREEIAKFRRSCPRRWWDANGVKVVAWTGAIVSVLTALWNAFGASVKRWIGL